MTSCTWFIGANGQPAIQTKQSIWIRARCLQHIATKAYTMRLCDHWWVNILLSDSVNGLQKQLNGLFCFCSDNMMIVNEMKTKVMVNDPANRNFSLKFNGKTLDIVDQYKYLGNITKSIKTWNGDMFGANYQHLCNKARQAIFALFKRVKTLGILPVKIMMYLFRSLIMPILVYGSDVWGINFNATKSMDTIFLWYARTILVSNQIPVTL